MKIQIQVENLRSTTVPADLDNHVLVHRKYFYTLPPSLLKLLVDAVGGDSFVDELLELEFALSAHVGDHGYSAGCLDGNVLQYEFLGDRKPLTLSEENARRIGLTKETVRQFERTANHRIETLGIPGRGYVGWLLTNPVFLDEHDDLFRRSRDDIRKHGIPKPMMAKPVFGRTRKGAAGRSDREPFILEFRDFCHRWRLQTFAGPYLPLPNEPQIPDLLFRPEGLAAAKGTTTNSIPDIFPVGDRGELQSAVDDAVHGGERPSHLADWYAIIDSANSAKNPIIRYVRLFRFQHFVCVWYSRHARALYRKKTHMLDALAEFFNVSKDTIKSDWKFLDDNVGKDWRLRTDPLA